MYIYCSCCLDRQHTIKSNQVTSSPQFFQQLFRGEKAVPAILEFLGDTRVGKMPGLILPAGGPDLEEEDLEVVSLLVQGEGKEGTGVSLSEEEDGLCPPL